MNQLNENSYIYRSANAKSAPPCYVRSFFWPSKQHLASLSVTNCLAFRKEFWLSSSRKRRHHLVLQELSQIVGHAARVTKVTS